MKRKGILNFRDNPSTIVRRKRGELTSILTKRKLKFLYYKKNKSLEDIAKEYGCSRQYIMKLMQKCGIERKTQSEAMIEAIKKGKYERFEYHKFNEKFFSKWSPEMGWALGLLFTDGHIHGNTIHFTSVDKNLLEKVKTIFQSSRPIYKRTQSYDKSKHIYAFVFSHPKTGEDLKKLGLHEKKSLDMVFPVIPEEYMRHFIRGCWDGDGSIFFEEHKLIASYISGSKMFIEKLVEELYRIGIYKKTPPYEKGRKRILLPIEHEIWSKYPNHRFPLTIYMKNENAYYIKISTRENVEKLFHYFYDGVDESMYLSRKYDVFVKGLKLEGKSEKNN